MFRAEKSYAVSQGKWYFEFEAVTVGEMRVGWARPSVRADTELGADELAYVFNGFKVGDMLSCKCTRCAGVGWEGRERWEEYNVQLVGHVNGNVDSLISGVIIGLTQHSFF